MNALRVAISVFMVVLISLALMGWIWAGSNQPPGVPQRAARVVLALSAFAGVAGLVALWRPRRI